MTDEKTWPAPRHVVTEGWNDGRDCIDLFKQGIVHDKFYRWLEEHTTTGPVKVNIPSKNPPKKPTEPVQNALDPPDSAEPSDQSKSHQKNESARPEPIIEAITPEPANTYPGYPIQALGPVLAEAAQAIASTVQAPTHLAGQSVLAATALAVQAHANVGIDNRIHPLSLNFLTMGESGERKSWTDRIALKQHREWEREKQEEAVSELETHRNELATWNADRKKALQKNGSGLDDFRAEPVRPADAVFICVEPTLEGLYRSFRFGLASQGLFNDEGGQFYGGYAMNTDNALKTMAGMSKFWDGAPIIRTRAASGESWAGYHRRLSCHLMLQPIVAQEVLGNELMQQQGHLARYLMASGNNLFGQRQYREPCPDDLAAIDRYHAALKPLLKKEWKLDKHGGLVLATIKPTAGAMKLWVKAYDAIEEELADGGEYKTIRAAASKMAENIARMAGVMAAFSGHSKIIVDTMSNAITLGDYYLDQYLLNTRSSKEHKAEDEANKLLGWLKSRGKQAIDVDIISRYAPTKTGARGSVDRARAMMLRLAYSHFVRCTKFNTKDLPAEWEIL